MKYRDPTEESVGANGMNSGKPKTVNVKAILSQAKSTLLEGAQTSGEIEFS